jgi:cytochrome c oxidase cbb3-type subunit 3
MNGNRYETSAYQLSEGKRLYSWFNCKGCHANGGGGSGPALIDGRWKYGGDLPDIVATIRDGRPNGMPAYGEKATAEQIWQLAGYVRALGQIFPQPAAPGRSDGMQARPAENRTPAIAPEPKVGGR